MMILLLNILKILGIILLCLLLLLAALLLLVLFVPVRYQVKGRRTIGDEAPVRVALKVNWLLHIVNAAFRYPEEAYLKVRIFCFTIFSTKKKEAPTSEVTDEKTEKTEKVKKETDKPKEETAKPKKETAQPKEETSSEAAAALPKAEKDLTQEEKEPEDSKAEEEAEEEENPTILKFFKGLFRILKNIQYTIRKICDKIKHTIRNIRYYIAVIRSDSFQRAFGLCREETLQLLKSILPRKLEANLTVGLGDPANTAQILAVHGMLYPLIGNHIFITPDFENSVFEGDFFFKGKITLFRVLKTAIKVYFNKDLRKVIRLLKREAA